MAVTTAYIGLGGNLGDRKSFIERALELLSETESIRLRRVSEIIETEALSTDEQPSYLNAVAELQTVLGPEALYTVLADIEAALGRVRRGKWSPRTIDLDLLLFGSQSIKTPNLTVPHPQMHLRSFVLKGLCQLDGSLIHPVLKVSVSELAGRLGGLDFAIDPESPQLISIAGNIGVGKTTLAKKLVKHLGCEVLFEPYDTNPFLPEVYAGKSELALDSQLYFLTARVRQLSPDTLSLGRLWVSDYVFDKELIYAKRLLDARQFALYEEIYPPFAEKVAPPVLVIYMRDTAQNCLEHIHNRNRPYEQRIDLQFLENLTADYDRLFAEWKTCPVIRAPKTEDVDVRHLAGQVVHYLASEFAVAGSAKRCKVR